MSKQLLEMEELFKALADSTRLRILGLLLTGEVCVCDIHQSLKIPQDWRSGFYEICAIVTGQDTSPATYRAFIVVRAVLPKSKIRFKAR